MATTMIMRNSRVGCQFGRKNRIPIKHMEVVPLALQMEETQLDVNGTHRTTGLKEQHLTTMNQGIITRTYNMGLGQVTVMI